MSYFNGWPFRFVIFVTILFFRFALVDMVSFTIIQLALLRYAQLSIIKVKNSLLMKLIYILNNFCGHSRRSMWKLFASE